MLNLFILALNYLQHLLFTHLIVRRQLLFVQQRRFFQWSFADCMITSQGIHFWTAWRLVIALSIDDDSASGTAWSLPCSTTSSCSTFWCLRCLTCTSAALSATYRWNLFGSGCSRWCQYHWFILSCSVIAFSITLIKNWFRLIFLVGIWK